MSKRAEATESGAVDSPAPVGPVPTVCRIVLYKLSAQNAADINQRRKDARETMDGQRGSKSGLQTHVGNDVKEGDIFPMIITRVWGADPTSAVNGQVFLDGNDLFWATSTCVGDQPAQFAWPVRS